jgi:threonine/homoserine/homoserine lactone efflux protein
VRGLAPGLDGIGRPARLPARARIDGAPHPSCHGDLLLGTLLSLANPFAVVFWLSVGGGLLPAGALAPQLPIAATAVGAFILATLIWSVLLAAAASYGRALITAISLRWLNAGPGVCMVLFGIGLVWQTLTAR